MIALLGLDHRKSSVETRGRLSFSGETLAYALRELHARPEVDELVILSTCNRTELYLATADPDAATLAARTFLATAHARSVSGLGSPSPVATRAPTELDIALYEHQGLAAVNHLYHVAAGLRSMVIGEAQILGQTREALASAEGQGTCGEELRAVFTSALQVGKKVRAETGISRNDASVASVAVHAARSHFGSLAGASVVLVGAGRTNELIARLLREEAIGSLTIVNRNLASAQNLAARFNAAAATLDALPRVARDADALICATAAPHSVVTVGMLTPRATTRPLLIVDLAVPADVSDDVRGAPGVTLLTLDSLHDLPGSALEDPELAMSARGHQAEIADAERLIEATLRDYTRGRTLRLAAPGIAALRQHVDASQERELAQALAQLPDLTAQERAIIERFGARLVDKMFHHLVRQIRTLAEYDEIPPEITMRVLTQLFTRGEPRRPDSD